HELGVGKPLRHRLGSGDRTRPLVTSADDQHRMGHAFEDVLDVDPPVLVRREVPQDLRRTGHPRDLSRVLLDPPIARVGEVPRQLVDEQLHDLFRRLRLGLPRPRRRDLLPELGGLEHIEELLQPLRSEEHTSELQSPYDLVCRLLLEKKKKKNSLYNIIFYNTK